MISARLEEGTSIKTCNQCKADNLIYETSNVEKMLKHLNNHRLDEQIELQKNPLIYRRVLKE